MLSQFTHEGKWNSLADLNYNFEKDVYPVGRLDADSEGLLLLTNDKKINQLLLNPINHITKTYLVQVEGIATEQQLQELTNGVSISAKGKMYEVNALKAEACPKPNYIQERIPPILEKRFPNTTWMRLSIDEGKNRQVRKMTASVGLPTLRLIRISIGNYSLADYTNVVNELKTFKI